MSAAAPPPPPPPHHYPIASSQDHMASNGYQHTSRNGYGGEKGGSSRPVKPYPHLKDLYARAQSLISQNVSLEKLLLQADNCLSSAQTSLDFKRPEMALSDFLQAQIIMSQVIPSHQDTMMLHDRPRMGEQHRMILKV
jgi:ubiquitin carboxyl-terminal hydrolase 8